MPHLANVQDLERAHGVTWDELTQRVPELTWLLRQARQAGAACRGWADVYAAFSPFRHRLDALLGPLGKQRGHPVLGSLGAYQVAYWTLRDAVTGPLSRSGGPEAPASA
jgi:hypothetical protein